MQQFLERSATALYAPCSESTWARRSASALSMDAKCADCFSRSVVSDLIKEKILIWKQKSERHLQHITEKVQSWKQNGSREDKYFVLWYNFTTIWSAGDTLSHRTSHLFYSAFVACVLKFSLFLTDQHFSAKGSAHLHLWGRKFLTTPKQNCSCNLNNDNSGYKFASCVYQNVKTVVSRRYWLIQGRDFLSLIALCCPALKYQMEKWLVSPSGEVWLWSMTNEFTRDFI